MLRIGSRGAPSSLRQVVDACPAKSLWQHAGMGVAPPTPVFLEIEPDAALLAAAGKVLSTEEAARASKLRDADARSAFTLAHACLRMWLAREIDASAADLEFEAGQFGKPSLVHGNGVLHFNLSRRPGWAAIALGTVALGVDVEVIRPDIDIAGIAGRFYTDEERRHVLAGGHGPSLGRFFAIWSRKEALLKAAGLGVDSLGAAAALKSAATLTDDSGASRSYAVHSLESPAECSLALATEVSPAFPAKTWPNPTHN
nr:4'-phosphopantetheinyl transferase superfamily protein [Caenimonas aquaedulcis]